MEDFVTVDEVGADVEDTASEPPSPSSILSSSKPICTPSSKDSKSSIPEDQPALSIKNMEVQSRVRSQNKRDVTSQKMASTISEGESPTSPGRRRSTRGKKDDKLPLSLTEASETPLTDEETPYKVLDSVEEETPDDEVKVTTSTRGRRGSSDKKEALKTPARKRPTAVREPQELSETRLPDQERATNMSDALGEECEDDATYKILDSVGDEVVEAPTRQRKRGRPKKTVKAQKDKQPSKDDASEKVTEEEEEEMYQVIDSVEEDAADDRLVAGLPESPATEMSKTGDEQIGDSASLPGLTKDEEEEEQEPPYQRVSDSLSSEAVSTATKDISECPKAAQAFNSVLRATKVNETVPDLEVRDDSAAAEGSGTSYNGRLSRIESTQEDKPETESQNEPPNPEEAQLGNLDEVSEEEENYPDDTAEEEDLRKRQAGSKEKREANLSQRTGDGAPRSRSNRGKGRDRSQRIMETEREKQNEDSVEEDTKELLTLDEVGADEPEEERAAERRDKDEITETQLQSLITLDEVREEGEDKMVENNSPRTHPLSQEVPGFFFSTDADKTQK